MALAYVVRDVSQRDGWDAQLRRLEYIVAGETRVLGTIELCATNLRGIGATKQMMSQRRMMVVATKECLVGVFQVLSHERNGAKAATEKRAGRREY